MKNEMQEFLDAELMTMPSLMFKSIFDKGEVYFKNVMDTLVQIDNQIEDIADFVFVVTEPEPIYFKIEIEEGVLKLDDDKERDTLVVTKLTEIDVDCFLDNVLAGKEITKNKDIKRIILHYEFI